MINFMLLTAAIFMIGGALIAFKGTNEFLPTIAGGIFGACIWFLVFLLSGLLIAIVK